MHKQETNTPDSADPGLPEEVLLARLARNCIERHYGKLHSLSDLASMLRVDPAHLDGVMQRVCGERVDILLAQTRFMAAQRLLVQSSLTLNEIAAQIGFAHPAEFASAFHEHVGVSPWSFRHSPYHETIQAIQGDLF